MKKHLFFNLHILYELTVKANSNSFAAGSAAAHANDIYTTSPNPVVAFAQFSTTEKMQKFVRVRKRNANMQRHKLWASENKPASERRRSKAASKIKKFAIELDGIAPKRGVIVNYKTFKVSVRVGQKLVHSPSMPVSVSLRKASASLASFSPKPPMTAISAIGSDSFMSGGACCLFSKHATLSSS